MVASCSNWAVEVELYRAMAHLAASQFDEALATIARVLELEPDHLMARYMRGFIFFQQGRREESMRDFTSARTRAMFCSA